MWKTHQFSRIRRITHDVNNENLVRPVLMIEKMIRSDDTFFHLHTSYYRIMILSNVSIISQYIDTEKTHTIVG